MTLMTTGVLMIYYENVRFIFLTTALVVTFLSNHFMDQRIINLYDEYTHKPLKREEFLRRLTMLVGSAAAAMAVLPLIEVNYANAAVTSQDDLFTERISYPGVPA